MTQPLTHYTISQDYKDDDSGVADMLEAISALGHFGVHAGEAGEGHLSTLPGWIGLVAELEANWQRHIDTVYFKVTQEINEWDWGTVTWSMTEPHFLNGQSTKFSNITCKPKRVMLDDKAIKKLTDGLFPSFHSVPTSQDITTTITPLPNP